MALQALAAYAIASDSYGRTNLQVVIDRDRTATISITDDNANMEIARDIVSFVSL